MWIDLQNPPDRLKKSVLLSEIIFESRTILRQPENPEERRLTLGKIQNLRVMSRSLSGTLIGAGQVFSFWRLVGKLTRSKGYVVGREIREGCIIPSRGGGICQITNVLFQGAMVTGCEIIERHSHSMVVPGSELARGMEATVAWNDVDLRFRPNQPIQIECFLTSDELVVRFRSESPVQLKALKSGQVPIPVRNPGCCVSCGQLDCSRHSPTLMMTSGQLPTYILDASWPEWKVLVHETPGRLLVPRSSSGRYSWGQEAEQVLWAATIRSLQARLDRGKSPPEVRRNQIRSDEVVAKALSRKLSYLDDDLVVAINLLPGLWRTGQLSGRRFRVLMTRPPLAILHRLLDEAQFAAPEAHSLSDFRADEMDVEIEDRALSACSGMITCHAGLARLLEGAVELREWMLPDQAPIQRNPERLIVFPGPATARSGSHMVRELARAENLKVALLSSMLEPRELWDGIELVDPTGWESRCMAVVQPSVIENRPTVLLKARALGIPILTCPMCGLREGDYDQVEFGKQDVLGKVLAGHIVVSGLGPESNPKPN